MAGQVADHVVQAVFAEPFLDLEFAALAPREHEDKWVTVRDQDGRRHPVLIDDPNDPRYKQAQRLSEKVLNALKTHKPSTAEKQRWAEKNEEHIQKMIGKLAERSGDNDAMDVLTKIGTKLHGVEVKTFLDNGNDKVTMHPSSRERKEAWAKANRAVIHTVVIDDRPSFKGTGERAGIYYRRGVGSFRLGSMTEVKSAAHLKRLMTE